jgi:hypothetical protein
MRRRSSANCRCFAEANYSSTAKVIQIAHYVRALSYTSLLEPLLRRGGDNDAEITM